MFSLVIPPISLDNQPRMSSADFDRKSASFLEWFNKLPGASFSDAIEIVDLRFRHAGRGIIATQDIPADTEIVSIPRNAIISSETSELKNILPALFESHGDEDDEQALDSWSALVLVMMYEFFLGDQSKWKPYLDVLPDSFDTPMFWSDEELSHLQASAVVNRIGKASAEDMFRTRLIPAIRQNPDVFAASRDYGDHDLIKLAHRMGSTVMAFAFDLENDGAAADDDEADGWVEDQEGKSMMGMVAMADMLNADAEFNAHVNHGDDELTITTLRDVKAGDEILNCYGPHPNSELLRRYGYVTSQHSRYDVVEIPWEAVQDALMSELNVSREVLARAMEQIDPEDLEDVFVLERESGEPNPDGTLDGVARVEGMPADLKEQLKTVVKQLQKMNQGLIPDKRKRNDVLQSIVTGALRSIASRYTTTVAEDQELLKRDDLPHRQRMAITVRLGEKLLMQEAFNQLSEAPAQSPETDPSASKRARRGD